MRGGALLSSRAAVAVVFLLLVIFIAPGLGGANDAAAEQPGGYTRHALGLTTVHDPEVDEPTDAPVTGETVHGSDDRIRVFDTTVQNLRSIAWLEMYDEFGEALGTCTGTLIGPDAVLTAAHCLYGEDGWVADIVVVPGKNGSTEPFGYQFGIDWWVPDQWIDDDMNSDYDWGIIKLPDYALANLVGYRPLGALTTDTLWRDDIVPAIVGYPGDKPEGQMWLGAAEVFDEVEDTYLGYDIDTAPGQSGSAVIAIGDNPNTSGLIVGVHNLGGTNSNYAVRVRQALIEDLDVGCRLMECTFWFFYEVPPPAVTLMSWKFCNTPFVCGQTRRIATGDVAFAQFTLSSVPTQEVSATVYYDGGQTTLNYPMPYNGAGFVTDDLGDLPVQGTIRIEVFVGGDYIGQFSTEVKRPLNFRAFSWGLSAP